MRKLSMMQKQHDERTTRMENNMTAEEAWKKYNALKEKIQDACDKMASFVCWELGGYGHLADGFNDDLYEDFAIAEDILKTKFGPDPEGDDDYDDDYDEEDNERLGATTKDEETDQDEPDFSRV